MASAHQLDESWFLRGQAIEPLREGFRGELIAPGSADYENARRVWNGNVDRFPGLVARCTGVADVQRAVDFAREREVVVSVRGGGHSAPGYGTNDGGFVIDLSPMKGIRVDPHARTARAEGGVLWRELDRETQVFGLATTGGTVSSTGIAGLTLGGGLGWLMGKYGLTVDNLISADVVTADGAVRTASAEEEPDLFWALRGGGGNFGVVTSFEYRLHPVTNVLGGLVVHPLDRAGEVMGFYREFCAGLPDDAECFLGFLTSPEGQPVVAMVLGYNGPLSEGEEVLAPARQFGQPVADLVGPVPYVSRQCLLDEPIARHGLHRYWRSAFTAELSDEFLELVVEEAAGFTSPLSSMLFFYLHGAGCRVPNDQTAFAARRAQWDFDVIGQWGDPAESAQHIDWVRQAWDRMSPVLGDTGYVNHLAADDPPDRVRASYGTNLQRLRQLKTKYDPTNFFRLNPNIAPG